MLIVFYFFEEIPLLKIGKFVDTILVFIFQFSSSFFCESTSTMKKVSRKAGLRSERELGIIIIFEKIMYYKIITKKCS